MTTFSYKLLMMLSLLALISMSVPVPAQETEGVSGTTPMNDRGAVSPLPVPEMATEEEKASDETPGDEVRGYETGDSTDSAVSEDHLPQPPTIIEPSTGPENSQESQEKPWWRFW